MPSPQTAPSARIDPAVACRSCRFHRQGRHAGPLLSEIERSRSAEGTKAVEEAHQALARSDPELSASDTTLSLDSALAYAHRAFNALLHQYRMPTHDPDIFAALYDVTEIPFRELL